MDRANTIIVCIMFGAWIRKIRRISLKGFGTIRQKIRHCDFLLHRFMFHNENLAGKRRSSPSSCCLQGIRFPGAESLPRLVAFSCNRHLVLYEVKQNPSPPCKRQRSSNSSDFAKFASPIPEPEDMEVEFPLSPPWDPNSRPFWKLSRESSSIGLYGTKPHFLKPIFKLMVQI